MFGPKRSELVGGDLLVLVYLNQGDYSGPGTCLDGENKKSTEFWWGKPKLKERDGQEG